jgi:hypothetical protein
MVNAISFTDGQPQAGKDAALKGDQRGSPIKVKANIMPYRTIPEIPPWRHFLKTFTFHLIIQNLFFVIGRFGPSLKELQIVDCGMRMEKAQNPKSPIGCFISPSSEGWLWLPPLPGT